MRTRKIWVDDLRTPPSGENDAHGWDWFTNSEGAIRALEWARTNGVTYSLMSLDHDLGGDDTTRPVVLWCCENDYWPTEVVVHSANPVGREWLEGMIKRYRS